MCSYDLGGRQACRAGAHDEDVAVDEALVEARGLPLDREPALARESARRQAVEELDRGGTDHRLRAAGELHLDEPARILHPRGDDPARATRVDAAAHDPDPVRDDSGVSRNNLSAEYVLYASRYRPTYDMIKETAFNSIRLSFLSDAEKTAELARLTERFGKFEARIADMAKGLPGAKGP